MILLFFFIIILYFILNFDKRINVKSVYDNIYYKVQNKINSINSVIILSRLRLIGKKLIINIDKNNLIYKNNIEGFLRLKKIINTVKISESKNSENNSYTLNKGDEIVLCIRSALDNKFHNFNEIVYIFIHELSHIICSNIGHSDLFYDINVFLLNEAIRLKLYKFKNYNLNPIEYCGIKLNEYLF